jgi:hypothetical protein
MFVPDVRGALSFRWGGQRRRFPHVPVNFHTATLHVSEHSNAQAVDVLLKDFCGGMDWVAAVFHHWQAIVFNRRWGPSNDSR